MAAVSQPEPGDELGPVDFLAIEFPGGRLTSAGFEQLLSLVDRGVVDILDMEFIVKDAAGSGQKVDDWQAVLPAASPLAADDEYRGVHVRRRQERASRQRDADG